MQKRYWLRGILAGVVLYLFSTIFYITCLVIATKEEPFRCFGSFMLANSGWIIVHNLYTSIGIIDPIENTLFTFLVYLFSLIEYVLIFMVLGWFFGIVKKRIKKVNNL